MNKKLIIESLAMDLKRVALGLHRKSFTMADHFKIEALKREQELEELSLDSYLEKLAKYTKNSLSKISKRTAEDALMLSILFQNYARKKF